MDDILIPIVFALVALLAGHAIGLDRAEGGITRQCVEKRQFEAQGQRYECRKLTVRYE